MVEALDIQVKGIVQGVGFRPFVYRLAKKYQLNGWVLNAVEGVFIHAEGCQVITLRSMRAAGRAKTNDALKPSATFDIAEAAREGPAMRLAAM